MPIGKSSIARAAKVNEKATAEAAVKETKIKKTVSAGGAGKKATAKSAAPAAVNTGVISALSPEVMEKVIEKKPATPENESRVSLGEDMPYFLL